MSTARLPAGAADGSSFDDGHEPPVEWVETGEVKKHPPRALPHELSAVRRRPVGKCLIEALSLTIWALMTLGTVVAKHLRRAGIALSGGAPRPGDAGVVPGGRRRRVGVVAGATVAAAGVAALCAGPVLRLAARPLAGTMAAEGLPAIDQRSTVLAVDGSTLASLHDGINRHVVPLGEVPDVVRPCSPPKTTISGSTAATTAERWPERCSPTSGPAR